MRKYIKKATTAMIIASMVVSVTACSKDKVHTNVPTTEKTTQAATATETETKTEVQTETKTESSTQATTSTATKPTATVSSSLPIVKKVVEVNPAGRTTTLFDKSGLVTSISDDMGTNLTITHVMNDNNLPSKVDYPVSPEKKWSIQFNYTYKGKDVEKVEFVFSDEIKSAVSQKGPDAEAYIRVINEIMGHYKYYDKFKNATLVNNVTEEKRTIKDGQQVYALLINSLDYSRESTWDDKGNVLKTVDTIGGKQHICTYTFNELGVFISEVLDGQKKDYTYTESTENNMTVYTYADSNQTFKFYISDGYTVRFTSTDGSTSNDINYNKYHQITSQVMTRVPDITNETQIEYY